MFVLCSARLPNGIDLADVNNLVEVENGTVSGLVIGTLFARFGGCVAMPTVIDPRSD